jgi:hypothetical protein
MAAIASNADGKYIAEAATVWVGGVAPVENDTATIMNGHDVEIDSNITVGADSTTAAIVVNSGGRLFVPSTVAGDYTLICKGDLKTDGTGGTIEFGTAANPIPNTRKFTVKLNYSASLSDGEFGLIIAAGGTFTCQGSDRWSSGLTDPDRCLLAADAAVNATSLTVNGSTAWKDNDYIAIAPTGTTYSQYEIGQLNGDASGTTLTVDGFGGAGGGLAYAHTGTNSDVRAEIINLTRNVVIMNYDGAIGAPGNVAYVSFATTATVDVDWTEFRYMGENAADKYGVVINTTSGSCNLNRCSFHHFEDGGVEVSGTSANNFTIQNNVAYILSNSVNRGHLRIPATTNSSWTVTNWWQIGCATAQTYGSYFQSGIGTTSYLRSSGINGPGLTFSYQTVSVKGTASNIIAHSCTGYGINVYICYSTLTDIVAWHNATGGLNIYISGYSTMNNCELYGNSNQNINIDTSNNVTINGLNSSGTTTNATQSGITTTGTITLISRNIILNSPVFSYTSGIRNAHTYDVLPYGNTELLLNNPAFGGSTSYVRYGSSATGLYNIVQCQNYDQTSGDHRTFINHIPGAGSNGSIIQTDTSYYRTAAPSVKMTPTSATYKLGEIATMQIPVASGANPTISVYLRKSASYNGNQPRLIVKRNDALGITADTVMATFAGGNDVDTPPGTFSILSGQPGAVSASGVLEVYVDCDGTAGFVNMDDRSVS